MTFLKLLILHFWNNFHCLNLKGTLSLLFKGTARPKYDSKYDSRPISEFKVYSYWIRDTDSEFILNSEQRKWIYSEFAKKSWIESETDSEFNMHSWNRYWVDIEYEIKLVDRLSINNRRYNNSLNKWWIKSYLKVTSETESESIANLRKKQWIHCEFEKQISNSL